MNELEYKYKLETTYSAHYLYIICRKMESYIEEGVRRRLPGLNKRDSSPRFVWLILTGLSPDIRELNCVSRYLDCVNVSSVALLTYQRLTYTCLWASLFLERIERTSETNLSASSTGSRFNRAVSLGSLNQDFIGIALSG